MANRGINIKIEDRAYEDRILLFSLSASFILRTCTCDFLYQIYDHPRRTVENWVIGDEADSFNDEFVNSHI